jgi:hypothetical protein
VIGLLVLGTGAAIVGSQTSSAAPPPGVGRPDSTPNEHHDVSRPLRDMPSAPWTNGTKVHEHAKINPAGATTPRPDGALQSTVATGAATTAGLSFAGVGNGDYGFAPDAAPPDTTAAVGATQYVQWVNESFAVFNKSTGGIVAGFPKRGNTLWSGFGGGCERNNDGDPVVAYDKTANRWVLTQFSVSSPQAYGYLQCVAVSTTSDATGTYNRYSFSYGGSAFNDYPKLGVWPDGYYISYNIFTNGRSFAGSKICAFDRARMLAGQSATQQCAQLSPSYGGLLPSDLDGSTAPPTGAPNVFASFGANALNTWRFHADFANVANATVTGPIVLPVASFSEACGGGACIPQPNTSQRLDSLADRLMYRLAYRNFGDHESWVVSHSVTAGSSVGVRWYELGGPAAAPTIRQQGTYAPDGDYRWMGSAAMDHVGNLAVGYSVSNSNRFPSIAYATRAAGDTPGTLGAETLLKAGTGSQTATLERWGDYSSMTIDPVDDCTFWYSTEYLKGSGTFNWSTWIGSFKVAGCGSTTTTTPPGAPTGLTATGGNGRVDLSWTPPSNGSPPTAYDVQRGTTTGGETTIASPTGTSYADLGVSNGTTYWYRVVARNSAGAGPPSAEASATPAAPPPPPPTETAAFTKSCSDATCTFDANASTAGITGFAWTFGDSTTGSGKVVPHTYAGAGTYTVTLTGSSASGPKTASTTVTCKKKNRLVCS